MGFDSERLFTEVLEEFLCDICLEALKNPKMLEKCGHIFCNECLLGLLDKADSSCPLDRKAFNKECIVRPIPVFLSIYHKLQIKCEFWPNCEEQINVHNYDSHCENCSFNPLNMLTCEKCKFQTLYLIIS